MKIVKIVMVVKEGTDIVFLRMTSDSGLGASEGGRCGRRRVVNE